MVREGVRLACRALSDGVYTHVEGIDCLADGKEEGPLARA